MSPCFDTYSPIGIDDVLLVEQDVQSLELRIVRRHAAIIERQPLHAELGHILLRQCDRQFLRTVIAEIEEDHDVAFADRAERTVLAVDADDRLDELVGHALVVRLLHGGDRIGRLLALALYEQVVCQLDALPTLVAVHRIVAADDRRDPAGRPFQMTLQRFDKTLTTARIGIASVHEAMHESLIHAVMLRYVAKLKEMVQRTVNPAVRDEAHEMHLLAVLFRIRKCLDDFGILQNRVVAAGAVDFHEVLIDDAPGTDIEVTHFGIAHLSLGQADVFAVGAQLCGRIRRFQRVDILGMSREHDIVVTVIAFAPAVQNHQ